MPLSEKTSDSSGAILTAVESACPPEPPRVVSARRGPVDPKLPGPPPEGTDSGPAAAEAI